MIPVIPRPLPVPFAENGERREIPDNNTVPGSADASWAVGFPPVTRINKQAGGKPPYGLDFQGIFHALSRHVFFSQSGGVYPWVGADGAFPGLDYLTGAHVLGGNGSEYVALRPSGPNVPNADGPGFVGPVDPVTDTGGKNGYWLKVFKAVSDDAPGGSVGVAGGGFRRGGIAPYYRVTFGGSDGRRPIFWGETEADEAYVLCDGGSDGDGGTVPDLRGRMILGASDTRPSGAIGGSETGSWSVSGTVGYTTLDQDSVPYHAHNVPGTLLKDGGDRQFVGPRGDDNRWTFSTSAVGGSASHTHDLGTAVASGSVMPPYYTLAYIMRIA